MHFWSKDAIIIENIDFHWFHNSPLGSARAWLTLTRVTARLLRVPGVSRRRGRGRHCEGERGRVTELAADSRDSQMSPQSWEILKVFPCH